METYVDGTEITIHDAPTREGYTFLYWKGSEYQPGDTYKVTEDHIFEAQWKKNESDKSDNKDAPIIDDTAEGNKNSGGNDKSNGIKTGDTSNIMIWILLIIVSLSVITSFAVIRRHRGN